MNFFLDKCIRKVSVWKQVSAFCYSFAVFVSIMLATQRHFRDGFPKLIPTYCVDFFEFLKFYIFVILKLNLNWNTISILIYLTGQGSNATCIIHSERLTVQSPRQCVFMYNPLVYSAFLQKIHQCCLNSKAFI